METHRISHPVKPQIVISDAFVRIMYIMLNNQKSLITSLFQSYYYYSRSLMLHIGMQASPIG
ncbi:Uncharacterised protein [Leminorella richardii]|uniref:Uncharacterized protein n=1 Tax=Leminorella richardii TaxID=158841 RepID=A0A2X4UR54_9GAMM|nr:Uncharacterised protein [Leminorella richardii]